MLYMYTTTVSLTNSSVMNIVGITASEEVGRSINCRIIETYRSGSIDALVDVLKRAEVNVYLNEVPYGMLNITDVREEVFRRELDKFLNKKGGKFAVASNSVLPIQLSKATV